MSLEKDLYDLTEKFFGQADADKKCLKFVTKQTEPTFDFGAKVDSIGCCNILQVLVINKLIETFEEVSKYCTKEEMNYRSLEDATVIHYAINSRHPGIFGAVVKNDKVNLNTKADNMTPLLRMMYDGDLEMIDYFFKLSSPVQNEDKKKAKNKRVDQLPSKVIDEFVMNMKLYQEDPDSPGHWTK